MKTYICREYLQIYLEFLASCGADVASSQWMRDYGAGLEVSDDCVPFQQVLSLRDEFSEITQEPLFPFQLGFHLADNLGTLLDYSLQSCRDLNEIAELSTRFHSIRSNVITLDYHVSAQRVEFEISHALEDENVRLSLLFAGAALTFGFLRRLFGNGPQDHFRVLVAASQPDDFAAVADQIPFPVVFDCARDCIAMDGVLLQLENPTCAPRLKMLLMRILEDRFKRSEFTPEFRNRVRTLLRQTAPPYPSMDDMASTLHLSKRTLARRLRQENTTYLSILEEVRIEESARYLEQGLQVNEIASQLGYESAAGFINLFKKKIGKTPGEYRKLAK